MKYFCFLFFLVVFSVAGEAQQVQPSPGLFDKNVEVLFKPKAKWGDGQDCSVGTVILRVEFLETGRIGQIFLIKGMTQNRNNEAIKAAKGIRFRPAKKDGKNISLFRMVEFSFSI